MNTETAPVSDHARRTARRVAALVARADALLITAGAGMSVDSGPPDIRDLEYLRARFDAAGRTFGRWRSRAWFDDRPAAAWAWYGHRERLYRQATPHDGYRILRSWAQAVPCGSFVATSNVDGQFRRAGFTDWQVVERHGSVRRYQCTVPCSDDVWDAQGPAWRSRPRDSRSGRASALPALRRARAPERADVRRREWVDTERREQQRRFDDWIASVRGKRMVVLECGAEQGPRRSAAGERLLERSRSRSCASTRRRRRRDEPTHVLRLPALQAITMIHESLPGVFGGAEATSRQAGAAGGRADYGADPPPLGAGDVRGPGPRPGHAHG